MATADRVPGHHRDDRLRRASDLDLEIEDVEPADALLGDVVVADVAVVAADALVAARAEGHVALAGQHDHADLGIVTRDVERMRQLEQGLRAERVAHLWPADRDLGDAFGRVVRDVAVVTRAVPLDGGVERVVGGVAGAGHRASAWQPGRFGRMPELVALSVPSRRFDDDLRRAWDDGNAAFPLDSRLARPAREAVLTAMAPTVVQDANGDRTRWPGGRPVEAGDALVVATSGTTGAPRGVVLTHDAVRASAIATSDRVAVDPRTDRWLACLPLAHVGGLSVVTRALVTGTPLTILPGFDADAVEQWAHDGATLVSLVPTALRRIDPSLFRVIVLGGAAPPEALPTNVMTTYGMTETGSGVVYDGVPLGGVEVAINEEDGSIMLKGPMLLRCYRDDTDPKHSGGWLTTGDIGELDTDGRLVVHGRRDDLIITGGENVWPDPVEKVLAELSSVEDVAIAARDDEEWGQRVVAFVVPSADGPPTLHALRDAVKTALSPHAAPRELVLVDEIPRTSLGKVRRSALPPPQ